ncbi:MAG: hypothetical protein WBB17_07265 [Saprospiraceae bacterium]|jgi:hypothetical protein
MKLYKQEGKMMNTKNFRIFVETGVVESVVIFRPDSSSPWSVLVKGERIPPRFHEWIETAKQQVRQFADLGTAYGVVRDAGWSDSILLEG